VSVGSNRARAKLAAKGHGTGRARRGAPSTAPYAAAAALTAADVGELQGCIDFAPTDRSIAQLDQAAAALRQPQRVTVTGTCGECGERVTVTDTVRIPALASIADQLEELRDRLSRFDARVLQRLIDGLGENASLWFTGGK